MNKNVYSLLAFQSKNVFFYLNFFVNWTAVIIINKAHNAVKYSRLTVKAVSHWARCEKARRIGDERCFHTEHETIDRLLLIYACTLGGSDQQCIFPQICTSYIDLTSSTAQYKALN